MPDTHVHHLIPYHFVPLRDKKNLVQPVAAHDHSLLEGRIVCRLTVRTPLFIPNTSGIPKNNAGSAKQRTFYSYDQLSSCQERQTPKNPVIPGSSLRGMLRAVHEVAANGCLHILMGKDSRAWEEVNRLAKNTHYAPCTGAKTSTTTDAEPEYDLCPTCSLFGMISKQQSHAGRIRVSDACAVDSFRFGEPRWLEPLMEPKIEAKEFYFCDRDGADKRLKGRKFYWHHWPEYWQNQIDNRYNINIEPIEEGSFLFDIYFDGVTEQELRQLAALINLRSRTDADLCFKLGNAKPQGYGSVKTSVESIFVRRLALQEEKIQYMHEDVTALYQDTTLEDAFGESDNLNDLVTILDFHALSVRSVKLYYPSQAWYQNRTVGDYKRSAYASAGDLGTIAAVRKKIPRQPQSEAAGIND